MKPLSSYAWLVLLAGMLSFNACKSKSTSGNPNYNTSDTTSDRGDNRTSGPAHDNGSPHVNTDDRPNQQK